MQCKAVGKTRGRFVNDKQLRGFTASVRTGSFSKAAEELYLSPQALIKQINQLETEVGARLLKRSPTGVVCTPAGQHFYQSVSHLENYMAHVIQECQNRAGSRERELRVGVLSTPLFMPSLCFDFANSHPDIALKQIELDSAHDYRLLLDYKADILESGRFETTLDGTGLRFTKLTEMQPVCVMAPSHRLAGQTHVSLNDLTGETVAVPNTTFYLRHHELEEVLSSINFVDKIFGREQMLYYCLTGNVFIMPEPAAVALRPLVSIPLDFHLIDIGVYTRTELADDEREFLDFATDHFS